MSNPNTVTVSQVSDVTTVEITTAGPQGADGSGGEANQNAFSNIAVSGQTTVAADSATDTFTLAAGSNVTITTDDSTDTITIAATDVVGDTSPQLGGSLDVNGQDIVSASNGAIELDPDGSGKVTFKGNATKGSGQFVLNCEQNSHGITIKGPPHSAAASYTLTLPNDDGTSGQYLQTDGSGVTSWASVSSGGISNLVEDTTPQLGGNLDMQANNITGTGTVIAASTAIATAGFRKVHASTSTPTGSDGAVGDIWVKY